MHDYTKMSRDELLDQLRALHEAPPPSKADLAVREREQLIHNLEVHQAELEMQNQQLREAQQLLEESQARYADLYDFGPLPHFTFDREGRIVEINLAGAALLGRDRASLLGKPFIGWVSSRDRPAFWKQLEACIKDRARITTELICSVGGKGPVALEMVSTPFLDSRGNVTGCRTVLTDVSDRKRGEEALRLAVRLREDFLAVVSHDLRNPLNLILINAELLLKTIPGIERRRSGRRYLEGIKRSVERMGRMLSDLLDLSSMDAGHLSMERAMYEVSDLISAVLETLEPLATQSSVQLEKKVEGERLQVYCDRERLVQVLSNLIGNAIKFTPQAGLVRVEAELRAGEVVFVVRDTGAGIAKKQLAHIFDPYWQAERTARKGAGLGLSIAKGIVQCHGGRIWAESQLGRGSSFFFTLPAVPPILGHAVDVRERRPASEPTPIPGTRMRARQPDLAARAGSPGVVLLVDDDAETRESLGEILKTEGYEVATAGSGREALDYLNQTETKPALILLDLIMPVMDGKQFLAQKAQDPMLAEIPVLLISGQVEAHKIATSLGLAGFIQKPVQVASLFQTIAHYARS